MHQALCFDALIFLLRTFILYQLNFMSFVSEYLSSLLDGYGRIIDGAYLADQLKYKGSQEVGGDYVNKCLRAQRRTIQTRYDQTVKRTKDPSFPDFVQDNILRLILNPFDRLIVAYQAYPSLKARFSKPGTFSHTFTEILNEGVFLGAFKGVIFNFAQLSLILYPAVYIANKNGSENKFLTFLSTYTFLDTLFYPLDSLKNILYADTLGRYNVKTVANIPFILDLYKGLLFKLAYNVPVLSGIYCTSQSGYEYESYASWALAGILYPLNTQKVRAQVSASSISTVNSKTGLILHSNYRGVVPYLLLNAVIGYSLKPIFSKEKLDDVRHQVNADLKHYGFPQI